MKLPRVEAAIMLELFVAKKSMTTADITIKISADRRELQKALLSLHQKELIRPTARKGNVNTRWAMVNKEQGNDSAK